jgi:hypothetical protein
MQRWPNTARFLKNTHGVLAKTHGVSGKSHGVLPEFSREFNRKSWFYVGFV